MKRTFTTCELRDLLDEYFDNQDDPLPKVLRSNKATGRTFEDSLVEEWFAIFEYEGVLYGFPYRKGSAYYESQCDPIDPFDHVPYEVDGIDCNVMIAREGAVTVYEIAPTPS